MTQLKKIKYEGKVFTPPFVVIRRTSSPKDKNRAVPTLITQSGTYAVENHLFILNPKDNKIVTCKNLVKRLKDARTNIWLNNNIRCRHLTKKSILDIPWWPID